MRIELIYRLNPGIRAQDADLSFSSKKVPLSSDLNPDGNTLVQIFGGWFNVKVSLVEADGTKVLRDFADSKFSRFYTSRHSTLGVRSPKLSSFIFNFNRRFGQMFIKVVSQEAHENPTLLTFQYLYTGPDRMGTPKLNKLEEQKEYLLPYTNDPVYGEQRRKSIGRSGTIVHCFDKNKRIIPQQIFIDADLAEFSHALTTATSHRKNLLLNRTVQETVNFYSHSVNGEIESLSKSDALAVLTEIHERDLFPNVVSYTQMKNLQTRLTCIELKEEFDKEFEKELATEKEHAEALLKVIEYNPKQKSPQSSKSSKSPETSPESNHDSEPELEFQADGTDVFSPDDFLVVPSTAKKLKLA